MVRHQAIAKDRMIPMHCENLFSNYLGKRAFLQPPTPISGAGRDGNHKALPNKHIAGKVVFSSPWHT
jgi:hypothetical protein